MAILFSEIKKFNPNHGSDGRFTTGAARGIKTTQSSTTKKSKNKEILSHFKQGWSGREKAGAILDSAKPGSTLSYKEDYWTFDDKPDVVIRELHYEQENKYWKMNNGMWAGTSTVNINGKNETSPLATVSGSELAMFAASAADRYANKWGNHRVDPDIQVDLK